MPFEILSNSETLLSVRTGSYSDEPMKTKDMLDRFGYRATAPQALPHVLFLIDQLCATGGAERVLVNTIDLLPKTKFNCSLATFKIDRNVDIFQKLPCPVHVLPLTRTYGWSGLYAARQLYKLVRSHKFSIVHTFFETSDLWGGVIAKASGCPVLVSSRRDMGVFRAPKHRLAYPLISRLYNCVLTVSEGVRQSCLELDKLRPEKVITLYNGLELDRVDAAAADVARASPALVDASHVVLTVAHLRTVKGIDTFLEMAALVHREFPAVKFLVVGDASDLTYLTKLQDLVQELGIAEQVAFVGPTEHVFSFLKASDVFCLLSRSEGFSNALIEAMACKLPCVATRVGGNPEAVEDGSSGFLVPPDDPGAAADRVLTLLRNPQQRRTMGSKGREIVTARFTANIMIERLVHVYESLLATQFC